MIYETVKKRKRTENVSEYDADKRRKVDEFLAEQDIPPEYSYDDDYDSDEDSEGVDIQWVDTDVGKLKYDGHDAVKVGFKTYKLGDFVICRGEPGKHWFGRLDKLYSSNTAFNCTIRWMYDGPTLNEELERDVGYKKRQLAISDNVCAENPVTIIRDAITIKDVSQLKPGDKENPSVYWYDAIFYHKIEQNFLKPLDSEIRKTLQLRPVTLPEEPDPKEENDIVSISEEEAPFIEELDAPSSEGDAGAQAHFVQSCQDDRNDDILKKSLQQQYLIAPKSQLNTNSGAWRNRRSMWKKDFGLQDELGRKFYKTNDTMHADSINDPKFYDKKDKVEQTLGRKLTTGEFRQKHYVKPKKTAYKQLSTFDPVLAEIMYRWFAPDGGFVLDPFAGGPTRGVVAAAMSLNYTGIDLAREQVDSNVKYATTLPFPQNAPQWIYGDSQNIIELVKTAKLRPLTGKYDMILTCPPYWNLEKYTDDASDLSNAKSYAKFLSSYQKILLNAARLVSNNRFIVIVVGNFRRRKSNHYGCYYPFVADTTKIMEQSNIYLYNDLALEHSLGGKRFSVNRNFNHSRKIHLVSQKVLVFLKGNHRKLPQTIQQTSVQSYMAGIRKMALIIAGKYVEPSKEEKDDHVLDFSDGSSEGSGKEYDIEYLARKEMRKEVQALDLPVIIEDSDDENDGQDKGDGQGDANSDCSISIELSISSSDEENNL